MKYPYFINPDINALPEASGEERLKLVRHIAACVGDEEAMRIILGIDPEEFAKFYPDMVRPELSTEDTISSFISRFSSEKEAEVEEIEEITLAAAVDYVSMLEDDPEYYEETPEDATSDAISAFLSAVPPKKPVRKASQKPKSQVAEDVKTQEPERKVMVQPVRNEPEIKNEPEVRNQPADTKLSEELLKLMVKNKNYEKALEIINELSLNNPKKSVYFAYQMRFIKKLIENQRSAEALK